MRTGKSETRKGIFLFSNFFKALKVRFMSSWEGGKENSGLDAKKSESVEEKVSAASDGVIAPEESDSIIQYFPNHCIASHCKRIMSGHYCCV